MNNIFYKVNTLMWSVKQTCEWYCSANGKIMLLNVVELHKITQIGLMNNIFCKVDGSSWRQSVLEMFMLLLLNNNYYYCYYCYHWFVNTQTENNFLSCQCSVDLKRYLQNNINILSLDHKSLTYLTHFLRWGFLPSQHVNKTSVKHTSSKLVTYLFLFLYLNIKYQWDNKIAERKSLHNNSSSVRMTTIMYNTSTHLRQKAIGLKWVCSRAENSAV